VINNYIIKPTCAMHLLINCVYFLVIITLVLTRIQQQKFEEARFISKYVLSERQMNSAIICVGFCLQNPECSAVRFTRLCQHCQLFSHVLWLHGSEIPPSDSDVVEFKMVNDRRSYCILRNLKTLICKCFS